jgi:hypothetical protein
MDEKRGMWRRLLIVDFLNMRVLRMTPPGVSNFL